MVNGENGTDLKTCHYTRAQPHSASSGQAGVAVPQKLKMGLARHLAKSSAIVMPSWQATAARKP